MTTTREKYYRNLFRVAAVYDLSLGLMFTFLPVQAFSVLGIREKLPDFHGYLVLLGAFVLVIGVAYFLISRGDLRKNRDLILVGLLYKFAYSATAIWFWAQGDLPHVAFGAVFGVADAVFFLLMADCFIFLKYDVEG
jgi:hypothetical protein